VESAVLLVLIRPFNVSKFQGIPNHRPPSAPVPHLHRRKRIEGEWFRLEGSQGGRVMLEAHWRPYF